VNAVTPWFASAVGAQERRKEGKPLGQQAKPRKRKKDLRSACADP
jgi:hypothetical protein